MVYKSSMSWKRGKWHVPRENPTIWNFTVAVFLALKKIGVKQYEDSDSKPGVGVSTLARHAAASGESYWKWSQL